MTTPAAKTPSSGPKPPAPRLVVIAAILLLVSGVAAVAAALTLRTDSLVTWQRESARDAISDNAQDKLKDARDHGAAPSGALATRFDSVKSDLAGLKKLPTAQLATEAKQIAGQLGSLTDGANKDRRNSLGDVRDQLDQADDVSSQISKTQTTVLIQSLIVLVALGIAGFAAYKGRHWARWAVLGLWVLATFTGSLAGLGSVVSITADIPAAFRFLAFVAGLGLVVAVVLCNLRPSVAFFNHGRPPRPARPAAGQRRGLFAPPPPRQPARDEKVTLDKDAGAARPSSSDRARTKQRTNSEAVAKGADLARSRAKAASKSRRTGN